MRGLRPGGCRSGIHTKLRPFFRFGCEYTENESWIVTPSTTCMPHDAGMTLDHHLAAHGPTGTTYGPPGLVFTPNRY